MNKLEYVARSLSKGTKKNFETYVINAIYQRVGNSELEIETQKYVRIQNGEKRLIDLYLPQFSMAIEVDEGYHSSEFQKGKDKTREGSIIQQAFKYSTGVTITFKRVKAFDVDLKEIDNSINLIVDEIKEKIKETPYLKWYYGEDRIELIKERGYIDTKDYFYFYKFNNDYIYEINHLINIDNDMANLNYKYVISVTSTGLSEKTIIETSKPPIPSI